jgi:hypothetical protein
MSYQIKNIISLAAGLLMAFTFIVSGTGKLFGDVGTPAQVMAFINAVLPEALLTPFFIVFIYKILVPVLLDMQGGVGSSYGVMQLPATFVLDQSSVIRSVDPKFETQ